MRRSVPALTNLNRIDLRDASGRTPLDVANGVLVPPLSLGAGGANIPDPNAKANVETAPAAPALAGGRGGRGASCKPRSGPAGRRGNQRFNESSGGGQSLHT